MLLAAFAATLALASFASSASAAVTQKQAASRAVNAFGSNKGTSAVIVFGLPSPVKAGTKITQAGTTKPGAGSTKGIPSRWRSAGVRTVKAPKVLTASGRSYFFYEDRGPYELYQHPGRVALVNVATGRVTLSRTITWPPLVNGRLPAFLKNANGYRSSKYQVFNRPWTVMNATQQRVQPRNVFDQDPFGPGKPLPSLTNAKTIANRLAAENSCVLRVTDTLPSFWNAQQLNLTRSYVGTLFEQLEHDNPAFVDDRYGARSGESLGESVDRLVKAGCKDILLYIAGQGYSSSGEPVIHLGTSVRPGGLLAQQNLSATDLRTLVSARPGVTFKFKFDAPYSGGMIDRLKDLSNVLLVETPAATGDEAFAFVPEVKNGSGDTVVQGANPAGLLEFTNCELLGLKAFFDSSEEIDKATQAQNEGVSFLAEMLARSQELCNGAGGWADDLGAAPQLYAQKRGAGRGTNRPPKADPQKVNVSEDTPTNITLTGSDPDGDPLTFSITKPPDHGTLSGSGPNVTYTPSGNYVGPDDFSFKVDDGKGLSNTAKVDITVTDANDPPVTTTSAGSTAYTEGGPFLVIDGGVTVSDSDDTQLEGAIVRIHEDDFQPNDELEFIPQLGITGFYDSGTGIMFLSGTASVSDYQTALRDVRFRSSNDGPKTPKRILFSADDGDGPGAAALKNIAITNVNDPPQVDASDFSLAYTENQGPAPVDEFVSVFDPDSNNLTGAVLDADATWVPAEDQLAFVDNDTGDGITLGSYNDSTGVLTLTGTGTVNEYAAAVQAVTYENSSNNPDTTTRGVSFQVTDDGALNSNVDSRSIDITRVNDAPTLATSAGNSSYTEGAAAAPVDGSLTLDDVDDTDLEAAQVKIPDASRQSGDELTFTPMFGITTSGYNSGTGVLTLTGTASKSDWQTALRSVGYRNTADNNISSPKPVEFTVNDGELDSAVATKNITVTGVNDHSTVTTTGTALTYNENAGAVPVDSGIGVTDPDSTTLAGATIQITGNHVQAEDDLSFPDNDTGDGITSAGYNDGTGTLTLTGTGTIAQYVAALKVVSYSNNSDNPSTSARTVSFQVNDGGAVDNLSNVATRDININPSNDAPALANGGTMNYTENAGAQQITNTITASDADDTQLESASITISAGADNATDDLNWSDNDGLDSIGLDTDDNSTDTLTLVGPGTPAEYAAALRAVTFASSSDHPATSKTIAFTVNDGSLNSPAENVTVNITRVNDKPVVNMTDLPLPYAEGDGAKVIDGGVTLTDAENDQISGAEIDVDDADWTAAEDELTFPDTNTGDGITQGGYNDTTGTLTLTGTASLAAYEAALKDVRYTNSSDNPSTTPRTVTMKVTDTGTPVAETSLGDSRDINVSRVNDAPVLAAAGTLSFTEGSGATQITNTLTVSDADDSNLESASAEITGNAQTGDLLAWSDNNGADLIVLDGSSTATKIVLTGSGTLDQYRDALRAITFTTTNDNPSASKTVTFIGNDGDLNSAGEPATINITPTNDPPVADLNGTGTGDINTTATFSEPVVDGAGNPVVLAPNADALDPDAEPTLDSGQVTLTNPLDGIAETLSATGTANITVGTYDSGTGVLTLTTPSGEAPISEWTSVLRSITYNNTAATPTDTDRNVTVTLNDGDANSSPASTVTIDIVPQNVAPVLDLNGANPGEDVGPVAFTENGGAVTLAPLLETSDVDDTTYPSAEVKITNVKTGDVLSANPGATGIVVTYTAGTGTLSLSKSGPEASVSDYQTVLRSVTFNNTSDTPDPASRTITFTVTDGQSSSPTRTATVSVTDANDAPVNTVPGGQTLTEDGSKTFSSGNGNQISVSDADAGSNPLKVTLSVSNGTLALNGTTGLSFACGGCSGTGTGDQTMTFTGSQTDINAALNGLVYTPNGNYNGADSLAITTNDQGFTGAGGAQTTGPNTVGLTISAVNDPPTNTVPGAQSVAEDTDLTFAGNLSIADPDSGASDVRVTLTATNGVLTIQVADRPALSFGTGDGDADTTMTFDGTVAEVNTALDGLVFRNSPANYNGSANLAITTSDLGNTGSGGTLTAGPDNVPITVTPVNDAPTADSETFGGAGQANDEAHGNTTMQVDDTSGGGDDKTPPTHPHTEIEGDLLAGDQDPDGPNTLEVQSAGTAGSGATDGNTADGGKVTIEADGDFVYFPPATTSCDNGTDTFDYKISDGASTGAGPLPGTATGTVTINLQGCVWYVHNNFTGSPDDQGTAQAPFNTLASAEVASNSANTTGTVFVFDGDGSSTGYNAGFTMNNNERLIGEYEGLSVDQDGSGGTYTPDQLHPANPTPSAKPTLTDTAADVVHLANSTEVRGFVIDPQGGGGICGGAACGGNASSGSAIDDVDIVDGGTAGTQPGLEMDGSTGTHTVTDFTYDNATAPNSSAPAAVRLNNGGIVTFAPGDPGDPTKLNKLGGPALVSAGTRLDTSTFDEITVAGSGTGGVNVSGATGANNVSFGDGTGNDLALTTTGGTDPAFRLSGNAGTWTVPSAGTANVSATGGAAVDITNTTGGGYNFDDVDSTNSSNGGGASGDGINLVGLGATNFIAATGDIRGHTGIAVDLDGGSGTVTYPGGIGDVGAGVNDGTGDAARVQNRTGGDVALSGSMEDDNDTGGGVTLSGNTAGTTTLSGSTKQLNTGSVPGVSISQPDGGTHAITFSNGGLDIDTTSGTGFSATGVGGTPDGTVNVTGGTNSIGTGTGTGLNINSATIGASDVTFQSISTGAATSGIDLNNTGSAGELHVTGDGSTGAGSNNGSGGTLSGTTGDSIQLDGTTGPVIEQMDINNSLSHGINVGDSSTVNGSTFDRTDVAGAGDPAGAVEHGVRYEQTTGTHNLTGPALISNSVHDNVRMEPTTGTRTFVMDDVDVNGDFPDGSHGVAINGAGNSVTTSTIKNGKFDDHDGTGIQAFGAGDADMTTKIHNNQVEDNESNNIDIGASETGDTRFNIHDNTLLRAGGQFIIGDPGATLDSDLSAAIHVVGTSAPAAGTPPYHGAINNNIIGTTGVADSGSFGLGIFLEPRGDHDIRVEVTNNQIRRTNREGVKVDPGTDDGDGNRPQFDLHLHNNIVAEIENVPASYSPRSQIHGMLIEAENPWDFCVDFQANQSQDGGGTGGTGNGYRVNQFNAPASPAGTSTFDIEEFAGDGTNEAQVGAHVTSQNTSGTGTANSTGVFGSPVPAGACEHPTGLP